MSLSRSDDWISLRADNGRHYQVRFVESPDGGLPILEPHKETERLSSGDPFLPMLGSDDQVYRWSLKADGGRIRNHLELSPDQGEPATPQLPLYYGRRWYFLSVFIHDGVPKLMVTESPTLLSPASLLYRTLDESNWLKFRQPGNYLDILPI